MAKDQKEGLTPRRHRWIRWGALAVLALFVVYWVGANVALNTGVLRPVIAKRPQKLLVEWRSGWTILPGVVHVEGLRVRGQSRKMQWQCRFEKGTFHVSLFHLFGKTVRVSRGRGTDFEFYFRPRLVPGEDAPAEVGAMPEIEGLSNPPDPPPEVLYPPRTKKKEPWLVDVSDVLFEGPVDLWFGAVRMRGNGAVGGGVAFELRKSLEIRRGRLELEGASLTIDGDLLADELDVDLEASLSPFLPKETKGARLFEHFSGHVDLSNGRIPDLAVLNAFLPGDGRLLVSGDGSMRVSAPAPTDARAELDVTLTGVLIDIDGREIRGDISLRSRVEHGDLAEGRFELGETTFSLERMFLPDPARERREEQQAVREEKAEKKAARRDEKRRRQGKPAETAEPEAVEPAGAPEDNGWWAHFRLAGGTFVVGKPIVLDTHIDLEIRDTRPLLNLFFAKEKKNSEELKLPAWTKMVPNVKDLEGDASFDIGPDGTIIDDVLIKWFIAQPEFDDSTTLRPPPAPEP
jgi:hypothetical protein